MRPLIKHPIAIAALAGLALAFAALAIETLVPAAPTPIRVFQSLSDFTAARPQSRTTTFDGIATGRSGGNPTVLDGVNVGHSSATTFRTEAIAFAAVSSPHVLAPFGSDALELGDTTLTLESARSAGLFLIIPRGSNEGAIWTTTVTAADSSDQTMTVTIAFQGVLGEQQFVGFSSDVDLVSISFGPAVSAGASSVIAIDDVAVD
jgi:hypothetical protein